jgi:hypothetical protein
MKHSPGIPDGNLVDHISFVGHGLSLLPCLPAGPEPSWFKAGRRDLRLFLLIIDEFYIRRETVSSQSLYSSKSGFSFHRMAKHPNTSRELGVQRSVQ